MSNVPNFNLDVAKIATYVAKPSCQRNKGGLGAGPHTAIVTDDKENEKVYDEVTGNESQIPRKSAQSHPFSNVIVASNIGDSNSLLLDHFALSGGNSNNRK